MYRGLHAFSLVWKSEWGGGEEEWEAWEKNENEWREILFDQLVKS
jgi:hypothetical protein